MRPDVATLQKGGKVLRSSRGYKLGTQGQQRVSSLAHSVQQCSVVCVSRCQAAQVWSSRDAFHGSPRYLQVTRMQSGTTHHCNRRSQNVCSLMQHAKYAGHLCPNSMCVIFRDLEMSCFCNAGIYQHFFLRCALQHLVICHIGKFRDKQMLLC